jgi:hypothetical protein
VQRRTREQQRQQHRQRAQGRQHAAHPQLRVEAALDGVDGQRERVQQPSQAEQALRGGTFEPGRERRGGGVGRCGGDAQRHAERGGDR